MDTPPFPVRALLHRWFVEYNPTYLFSAALVLAGLTLVSCDLADEGALAGLAVTAVAETYALALIGGAALLVRLGQRRVAVMVGLLAALYQCDLTLHVETCAYLGGLGWALALGWAALFHVKLRLLARALELTPSRSALAVPSIGALGLSLLPHALRDLPTDARSWLVALFVFGLGALGLWTERAIESAAGYDYRGRRAIRGTWLMWAGLALAHVVYTSVAMHVDLLALAPGALLLTTRWARRERTVWITSLATLALTALILPQSFWVSAALVALVLTLRALRVPMCLPTPTPESAGTPAPYRGAPPEDPTPETNREMPETVFVFAERAARERLFAGALASAHLSAWTVLTTGGLWRTHVVWLDLVLVVVLAAMSWRARRPYALAPAAALGAHVAITIGWLHVPRGAAEYGVWAIGLGFALLGGSLATSWRLAAPRPREAATG